MVNRTQQFKLMKNVTESLAGRVGIVRLNSFTYAEAKQNINKISFSPLNFGSSDKINTNEIGISDKIAKIWLNVLVTSGIIY